MWLCVSSFTIELYVFSLTVSHKYVYYINLCAAVVVVWAFLFCRFFLFFVSFAKSHKHLLPPQPVIFHSIRLRFPSSLCCNSVAAMLCVLAFFLVVQIHNEPQMMVLSCSLPQNVTHTNYIANNAQKPYFLFRYVQIQKPEVRDTKLLFTFEENKINMAVRFSLFAFSPSPYFPYRMALKFIVYLLRSTEFKSIFNQVVQRQQQSCTPAPFLRWFGCTFSLNRIIIACFQRIRTRKLLLWHWTDISQSFVHFRTKRAKISVSFFLVILAHSPAYNRAKSFELKSNLKQKAECQGERKIKATTKI